MKVTATFLIATSLFTGQVIAAADLCAVNLQKLEDQSQGMPLGDPLEQQIETLRDAAIQAQFANNAQRCVAQSAKALQLLENSKKDTTKGE